jgi:hypothetical protein
MTTTTQWKFLRQRGEKIASEHGDQEWTGGEWYEVEGWIHACVNGFHCSPGILAALGYVQGEILAEVETAGDADVLDDKSAHRKMRIIRAWKWTKKDSVQLAVFAAEKVLSVFEDSRPGDQRPRQAIEAAKAWLANPSEANRYVANVADVAAADANASAAYDAASAAWAAGAAYDACHAYSAAYDAYAACAACADANAAARSQLKTEIEAWLQEHLADMEVVYAGE